MTGTLRVHRATLGSLAATLLLWLVLGASAARADFGIASFDGSVANQDGSADSQAGSHPYQATTSFTFTTTTDPQGREIPDGNVKDIQIDLPPGVIGNPQATPRCSQDLLTQGRGLCAPATQVGTTTLSFAGGFTFSVPVFNLVPASGTPAQFGFSFFGFPNYFTASVRTGGDYGLTINLKNITQFAPLTGASTTFWGVPADPSHDPERTCPDFAGGGLGCSSGAPLIPFLTNPTSCPGPVTTTMRADSWQDPGNFKTARFVSHDNQGNPLGATACDKLGFGPSLSAQPLSSSADSPTGLQVRVHMPLAGLEDQLGLTEAQLKRTIVTLPEGVSVNPSAADGLAGCTPAEIGLDNASEPSCPDASKVGAVEIHSPLLPDPLVGSVYVASQSSFQSSLLAIYVVAGADGALVKLPGKVELDPSTGQITTTFDDNPQLPFTDLKLDFFGGPRAALVTPPSCGTYQTQASFVPWSAADPDNPTPDEIVHLSSSFDIASGPDGGPCPSGSFAPKLSAGTTNPVGGAFSSSVLGLSREDGTQALKELDLNLPPGLTGKLAGVPYCGDAALAAVPDAPGTGAAQIASPSCPVASQIGTVTVGAGAGSNPLFVKTGRAYLAGPYKGAPLSLAVISPAVAGPFDLGNVMVRTALHVDPETTQLNASSDPLPSILAGVPLDLRDVRVDIDRRSFTLNPTSCEPKAFAGSATSPQGAIAPLSDRFQVDGCGELGFRPKLALSLEGGTRRGAHPSLRAVLKMRAGEANIGRAQVALPHSEFLDNAHIKTICTRAQFAANQCPAASVYGHARAITPLLDRPLEGPVYLRSSSHQLPDLVADLDGQIRVVLDGRIDSVNGGMRSTFQAVPDAPVSKFVLTMRGGKKGLLQNSTNLCAQANRASARFDGQNGRAHDFSPALANSCGKRAKKRKRPTNDLAAGRRRR